ncbi:hypothetical protein IU11_06685 [Cellulosimicrobium sp. MM]|nr:hypothetical protein [Cellulosimicrobium sp. MM]KFD43980.1 hypothetical protein IU11_06685 [Cellulosimicrobium sp. MM]
MVAGQVGARLRYAARVDRLDHDRLVLGGLATGSTCAVSSGSCVGEGASSGPRRLDKRRGSCRSDHRAGALDGDRTGAAHAEQVGERGAHAHDGDGDARDADDDLPGSALDARGVEQVVGDLACGTDDREARQTSRRTSARRAGCCGG